MVYFPAVNLGAKATIRRKNVKTERYLQKILSCTNREIVHDFFRDFEPWSILSWVLM